MDNFKKLVWRAEQLAWYGGQRTLFTLRLKGEFEGFRKDMRATEDWEHRVFLESEEIMNGDGKVIWPHISVDGDDVEEAAEKALLLIEGLIPPQ